MAAALAERGWSVDVVTRARPELGPGPFRLGGAIRVIPVEQPDWPQQLVERMRRLKRRVAALGRSAAAESGQPGIRAEVEQQPGLYSSIMAGLTRIELRLGEAGWCRRAARVADRLAGRHTYRWVIVSSPPHSTQRLGARVSRRWRIPYVADLRDPPRDPPVVGSGRIRRWWDRRSRARLVPRAALIIANTPRARRAFQQWLPPGARGRVVDIPNGWDDDGAVARPDPDRFRVVFAGWLYPFMEPDALFAACAALRERVGADSLRIDFMGTGPSHRGVSFAALARRHGLQDSFHLHPRGTREEASRLQQSAAVLVAFDASTPLAVPAKFYDYARLYGTMLLIGQREGALADAGARIGLRVYEPQDLSSMVAALEAAWRRWRSGDLGAPADPGGVFSRRRQSDRLARILEGQEQERRLSLVRRHQPAAAAEGSESRTA